MSRHRAGLGIALAAVLGVALLWGLHRAAPRRDPPAVASAQPALDAPAGALEIPSAGPAADREDSSAAAWLPPGFEPGDPAAAWAEVDLEAVREAMPDNLYWSLYLPTRDARVLAEREEQERYWREQRSLVESGNASEEEVDAYYAHRFRVHADTVEFTSHLIDHYGDALPERDLQLLYLARKLHLARAAELPRDQAEAQERRARQEQARAAWQQQQAAFDGVDGESLPEAR